METIDEEVNAKAIDFMERAKQADKPFFLWWNSTRMLIFTHLKKESVGKTGLGVYRDGMVEHDGHVGEILAKLEELGLEDNTIVMSSTDNGAELDELARWRHHHVPRREKHQLGRRLSRAHPDQVAWRDQTRHRDQRQPGTRRHAPHPARRCRRHHGQGIAPERERRSATTPTTFTSTATITCPHSRARPHGRARNSCTGPTTAALPPCATRT